MILLYFIENQKRYKYLRNYVSNQTICSFKKILISLVVQERNF